ncbi:hypothetical protein [Mesorhizobium shangrilense]|uniref:Uncharacterized protein n=1 Tax=Mesorhizobium shangrilense TaxID=460060 RepID=A0ABV2DNT1_9HYPH
MSKLVSSGNYDCPRPSASAARVRIGSVGSVALLTLLAGCAHSNAPGQIFDYASVTSAAAAPPSGRTTGQREQPRAKLVTAVLGTLQKGPGYTVESNVGSDGRYSTYVFTTEFGTYPVTGDDLARNHVQELVALDALKKHSLSGEFVHGAGNAVLSPIRGVVNTVTDPIGGAQGTYRNVTRRVSSVRRGLSKAGEFVTTFGRPERRQPERENESLLEKFVDRPKEKRRLAEALHVDPYTHFIPLSSELDKVASYSAAGSFGVNRGLGFVPGVAGTVISGLGTLDSLTSRTLDMSPDETAAINRERLEKLNIPADTTKRLLLSDKLTPTEKTRTVGFLSSMAGTSGLGTLASFVASSETRVGAFTAMQTLAYLSTRPFGNERVSGIEIVECIPVISVGANRRVALFTADDLAWTSENATQISKLSTALASSSNSRVRKEIWISANASAMTRRKLQLQGWLVKTNIFSPQVRLAAG